jgi:transketolase
MDLAEARPVLKPIPSEHHSNDVSTILVQAEARSGLDDTELAKVATIVEARMESRETTTSESASPGGWRVEGGPIALGPKARPGVQSPRSSGRGQRGQAAATLALSRAIRRHAVGMVAAARASHLGSALSISDIVAVLYGKVMRLDPANPKAADRDRFLLSKGHACVAIYAALAELGFFPVERLAEYGRDHSLLMNHISHKVPGVEFSTGSLGHGLPFGCGKALAAKRKGASWRVFVLMSDGELDEGSNWEALMFGAHHGLDNLVAIIDYNKLQSLTSVEQTLRLEPLAAKLDAFGWNVREIDGHDHAALGSALTVRASGKPSVVIAHTVKGKGVSFMENRVEWHYRSPNPEELASALADLATAG